jgi:ABC-type enterochelin transport system permease subunit
METPNISKGSLQSEEEEEVYDNDKLYDAVLIVSSINLFIFSVLLVYTLTKTKFQAVSQFSAKIVLLCILAGFIMRFIVNITRVIMDPNKDQRLT